MIAIAWVVGQFAVAALSERRPALSGIANSGPAVRDRRYKNQTDPLLSPEISVLNTQLSGNIRLGWFRGNGCANLVVGQLAVAALSERRNSLRIQDRRSETAATKTKLTHERAGHGNSE